MEKNKQQLTESNLLNSLARTFSIIFKILVILFLFFILFEGLYKTIINPEIILTFNLMLIIIFGFLNIVFPTKLTKKIEKQLIQKDFLLIVLLGTLIGFMVFLRLKGAGWIAYFIALIAGLAIIAIITLVIIKWINKKFNVNYKLSKNKF